MAEAALLELHHVTKRYARVVANDDVTLRFDTGEVVAVLGENGAGKSTVMNVIAGLVRPDSGHIIFDGREVHFGSPREAGAAGIGMVHQHFKLVPTMTVAENIVLGDYRAGRMLMRLGRNLPRIREIMDKLDLKVDPDAIVGDLDIGSRQKVELAKALFRGARLLILDEPTAVLSQAESAQLYKIIRDLADHGVCVVLISHKLEDVFAVCDRVYVMRQGKVVGERPVDDALDRDELVRLVVGASFDLPRRCDATPAAASVVIRVSGLTLRRPGRPISLRDATFQLYAGEILAIAGVEGNGQTELVDALAGLLAPVAGEIHYAFGPRRRPSARQLRQQGLGHVPGDRHGVAMIGEMSLRDNLMLTHFHMPGFSRGGFLRRPAAASAVGDVIERFDIRTPGAATPIGRLSGGNQQKLVVGRELRHAERVLLAAHPTRGLDVRTIAFMQRELLAHRARGGAVLLVSSDLNEIWQVADRVMVAAGGRLRGPVRIDDVTLAEVGSWMTA